jgi:putative toxin-antitoxin system antitoxin component (TIGR02293 family)
MGFAATRYELSPDGFIVPLDKLDELRGLGFSNDELHRRRRERDEPLSPAESDRALRLERIAEQADRVFGNREKAQRWLRKESRALEGRRPIDLLQSETGAHIIEEELVRIDYGMFA